MSYDASERQSKSHEKKEKREGSIQCMLIAHVASCNSDTTDLLVTRKGNESNHTEKESRKKQIEE